MSDRFVVSRPRCVSLHPHDAACCSFRVAWTINPHMRVGAVDPEAAGAEHARFVCALRARGASVLALPFVHGAFDSVFVKDSALVVEDARGRMRVLPATFATRERAPESDHRARKLARAGATVAPPLSAPLEGGDLCVIPHRRIVLMGHGVRTAATAAAGVAAFLGLEVVPLRLVDRALFHLDTALVVLADDTLVLCPDAFDRSALAALDALGFARTIRVPPDEARRFGLNVVELADGTIVTGTRSTAMQQVWGARLGRDVVVSPLAQFQLGGGSAACLVSRVLDLDARAAGAIRAA